MVGPLKDYILSIYGHDYYHKFNGCHNTNDVRLLFQNESQMWRDFKSNGGTLTVDLKSCFTGRVGDGRVTISEHLTNTVGLIIYAQVDYWQWNGTIRNNAGYNKFVRGYKVDWTSGR